MLTKAHHTCKKEGGRDFVEQESPFFAEHNPEEEKYQFLGSGYYFWDNNFELSKLWGSSHYNNDYFVIEFEFDLKSDECLDLVGNRFHQLHIINYLKEFEKETGKNKEKWSLCQCIEFLKELNKIDNTVFPFKLIRAVDLLKHTNYQKQFLRKFVNNKENYLILNPKMVICALEKSTVPLHTKKIIHES